MKPDSPIAFLCEVLEVSRKGYHAWSSGQRDRRSERDQPLAPTIHEAFDASWQTCGYPHLTLARCAGGESDGKSRVARLMRSAGLQGRQRGALRPCTTPGNHAGPIAPIAWRKSKRSPQSMRSGRPISPPWTPTKGASIRPSPPMPSGDASWAGRIHQPGKPILSSPPGSRPCNTVPAARRKSCFPSTAACNPSARSFAPRAKPTAFCRPRVGEATGTTMSQPMRSSPLSKPNSSIAATSPPVAPPTRHLRGDRRLP